MEPKTTLLNHKCKLAKTEGRNTKSRPFSDFKVSIAQELDEHNLLIQELENFTLLEETVEIEPEEVVVEEPVQEVVVEEEPQIDVLDEIYDFDDEGKKPKKERYTSKVKKVDTAAVIAKIKAEAKEKNKGKKVTTRRDINKQLKPYMLKKNNTNSNDDNTLTSIDIYLNAVNKIEKNAPETTSKSDTSLELNLDEILNDLDK